MPSRILKESVCTSGTLALLSAEEERLFTRLIVQCDDFGRYYAHPGLVRAACFPRMLEQIDDSAVRRWLDALERAGLIRIYTAEGEPYLQMAKWSKHQSPARAKKSKFPEPADDGPQPPTPADTCAQLPAVADVGERMSPLYVNVNEKREAGSGQRARPTKAELSLGFPFLAAYAEVTSQRPGQLTSEDVRAAEDLVRQERDVDELGQVLAWMTRASPYHGDPSKLRSVERNWRKFEQESARQQCNCGGGGKNKGRPEPVRHIVDHSGCPDGCPSLHPEQRQSA